MIELPITKDITKYKPKLIMGLTTRQVVCVIIAAILVIPTYIFLSQFFILDVVYFACLAVAAPPLLCGFYTKYEMPFEVFFKHWLRTNYIVPKTRKYIQKNTFEEFFSRFDDEGNLLPLTIKTTKKSKNNSSSERKNKQVSSDPDLFCAN